MSHSITSKALALFILLTAGLAARPSVADVRLPKSFSDHMVIQRDQPVRVWGWASPGESVTVTFAGQSLNGVAGKDGAWSVQLTPMKGSGVPQELVVSGQTTVKFSDVLVGDVWLISGQSNAAFSLGGCKAPEDIAAANFPLIRFSGYWEHFASFPQRDGGASWRVLSPATAASCTGIGFYFARKVQPEAGVPIGLLTCAVGGTEIENWMSPEAINNYPENVRVAKIYRETIAKWESELPSSRATPGKRPAWLPVDEPIGLDLAVAWLAQVRAELKTAGASVDPSFTELESWVTAARAALNAHLPVPAQPEFDAVGRWLQTNALPANLKRIPILPHPNDRHEVGGHGWFRTQSLYNGMIHPLVPFNIKGMLWYQGENGSGNEYFHRIRSLIETMRKEKGRDFPVYVVQLPNFGGPPLDPKGEITHNFPTTREQQLKCLQITRTGVAVTIDVGDATDLHPKNKSDVGERLALWALAKDYGKNMVYSSPLFKAAQTGNGKIKIIFDSVGGGLMIGRKDGRNPVVEDKTGQLQRFAIAGADKKWFWAEALIDGSTVVVSSPDVPAPVAVRYAFSMNPEGCNLYNKEGLPASPFRTDEW